MTDRNFSLNKRYYDRAVDHVPSHRFSGSGLREWQSWRAALLPVVLETLGIMPERVVPNAELQVEWEEDSVVKQRIVFDVEPGLSVAAYIFRPVRVAGRMPAIFACHGHGEYGKEAVMGISGRTKLAAEIQTLNYAYGLAMAKAGFVTMAIDWRGFNERDDRRNPHSHDIIHGRDPCDVYNHLAQLFGQTLLGQNVHDGLAAINILSSLEFVDPDRIGVMGLSFGGTMATWLALSDQRIKAANIICYSERFTDFGFRYANLCGSQITPNLFSLCDVPDLHGLIAPRPLLIEIGLHDDVFLLRPAMSCYDEVKKIYAAADCLDKLHLDLFPGPHRWNGQKSVEFFSKALGVDRSTSPTLG